MCGRTGTAILTWPFLLGRPLPRRGRARPRPAASARLWKERDRPSGCQPVAAAINFMPLGEQRGIAAELVDDEAARSAPRRPASITALVPTRLAITPPRSMSPISTTGTSAARAKPILAMSLPRRLISDALPAPSTRTRSASRLQPRKAVEHQRHQLRLRSLILGARGAADRRCPAPRPARRPRSAA